MRYFNFSLIPFYRACADKNIPEFKTIDSRAVSHLSLANLRQARSILTQLKPAESEMVDESQILFFDPDAIQKFQEDTNKYNSSKKVLDEEIKKREEKEPNDLKPALAYSLVGKIKKACGYDDDAEEIKNHKAKIEEALKIDSVNNNTTQIDTLIETLKRILKAFEPPQTQKMSNRLR